MVKLPFVELLSLRFSSFLIVSHWKVEVVHLEEECLQQRRCIVQHLDHLMIVRTEKSLKVAYFANGEMNKESYLEFGVISSKCLVNDDFNELI